LKEKAKAATLRAVAMKFLLSSIALGLLLAGCGKTIPPDRDSFQLTVEKLMDDGDTQIAVLKIVSPRAADMQLSHEGKQGGGFLSAILDTNGATATGQILLSAVKVACDTNWARIQVVTKASDAVAKGGATGTSTYPVRPKVKLEDFFAVTATGGTYKFFSPVKIATVDGGPVMLVLTNAP
jgi:hypothetical protein